MHNGYNKGVEIFLSVPLRISCTGGAKGVH